VIDLVKLRTLLRQDIVTEVPWTHPGWRNHLILNDWEIDVILERIRSLSEQKKETNVTRNSSHSS
jgi:hypothetical protein